MKRLSNIFTPEQHKFLVDAVESATRSQIEKDLTLGRVIITGIRLPQDILTKIIDAAKEAMNNDSVDTSGAMFVTYSAKYGKPNLPPHFDGDTSDLIFNYQLSSNTVWPLGVDLETFALEDNEAMLFNANEHVHWRPHKQFQDGEYVTMMFFRFFDPLNPSDYSHMRFSQEDEIFKDVRDLRSSL